MLPKTTQATHTEVEGDTTVELTGNMSDGTSLEEAANQGLENQTADSGTEEVQAEEAPQEQTQVESDTDLSAKPPRAERRTEKLIDALKTRTDEVSELRKQLDIKKGTPVQSEQANLPPWLQTQPLADEVTPEQYQAHVLETAHSLVNSELTAYQQRVDQYQNYKDDLAYVEGTYDILRQGSANYDPEKSKTVAELYQKASASDPKLRLSEFVDKLMSFHQAGQEIGKQELKTSVIKRESEAAVTPTPSGTLPDSKDSDWDSMTLKEKEAWMKANGIWDK